MDIALLHLRQGLVVSVAQHMPTLNRRCRLWWLLLELILETRQNLETLFKQQLFFSLKLKFYAELMLGTWRVCQIKQTSLGYYSFGPLVSRGVV